MAGAEVIETHSNWNYSRSLLFAWAIPYYHFGLRTSMPVGKHFTAGFHLVNGWNNVEDNNSGKTVGLTGALTAGPVTWSNNYYAGPEKTDTNEGWRHLYDTTLLVTRLESQRLPQLRLRRGQESPAAASNAWYGVAGAARFALTDHSRPYARAWSGSTTATASPPARAQKLKEFTLTGEYKMAEGVLSRLEYRRDWSDQPFFDRGRDAGRDPRTRTRCCWVSWPTSGRNVTSNRRESPWDPIELKRSE